MDTEKELIETIKKYHNEVIAGNINSYNSLKEAHAKAVEINNKECIVRSLSSLAWVNYIKGDLDLALSRYDEAISIAEKGDMPRALAAIYNNQALAYSRLGNRTLAISKFFKALELFAQLGVKSQEVNVLENVGCQYTDLGDLDKGEEYFLKAKEMKDAHDIKGAKGLNVNMAMLYLKKEAYAKALQTIEETIKDSSNTEHMLGYANSIKAMVLHKQGYHKKSLELVEQTIATAKKQKEQEKSLIVRQECFSTILNVEIGNYTKAKHLALNLIDKTKENANLINIYMTLYKVYVHEKDFEKALEFYQLHEKCMKKVDGSKAKNHLASVEGKYQNILKEKEKEILRLQKVEMEQKAIRAQLNPHFFFNALNSINRFILDNDQQNASRFLQNFSGLMRKTLENSEEMFITIEDEIGFLRDYLSLEQLRFKNAFQFEFIVDEEIEEDFVKIPTMLLQPYVENCIKHGVAGLENGEIVIRFTLVNQDRILCVVEDNGRGRSSSENKGHQSMGTRLLKERMKSLKEQFNLDFAVKVIDLKNSDKLACGTRVEVELPTEYGV